MKMVEGKHNRKWKQSGVRGALKAAAAIIEGNAISQNMNKVSHWIFVWDDCRDRGSNSSLYREEAGDPVAPKTKQLAIFHTCY